MTNVVDNISQTQAQAILRAAASGQYAECSASGCKVNRNLAACGGIGAVWHCEVSGGSASGQACSGSPSGGYYDNGVWTPLTSAPSVTASQTVTAAPPGDGFCPGTVNGQLVYVKCSNTTSVDASPTVTVTATGSGTVTVTSGGTTTCLGDTCTTVKTGTSTATVSGGGTTSTPSVPITTSETKADFCKDNPTSTNCKDKAVSSFSGGCASSGPGAFTCKSEDAAQCAIAQAVNETRCLVTPSTGIDVVSGQLAAGTFATSIPTTTVTIGSFNQDNPFSSSCPADIPFTVAGRSASIPLSQYCTSLQMLGNVLVAFTLFAATVFVIKGFA